MYFKDFKKELDRMVEEEILTSVNEPTDWVSGMVTVVKPNKLRICINPKDLNRAIKRSHYPVLSSKVKQSKSVHSSFCQNWILANKA